MCGDRTTKQTINNSGILLKMRVNNGIPIALKNMGALCGSEVEKLVDVNVPLTMNYRGINISKHKD